MEKKNDPAFHINQISPQNVKIPIKISRISLVAKLKVSHVYEACTIWDRIDWKSRSAHQQSLQKLQQNFGFYAFGYWVNVLTADQIRT